MESTDGPRVAGLNRATLLISGAVLVAVAFTLGAVIYSQAGLFVVDTWWNGIIVDLASPFVTALSRFMDFAGGGWFGVFFVPIAGTLALLLLRRWWSAAFFIVAQLASAGVVQLLKRTFGRARPDEIIVLADYGSFPSGHAANAATLAALAFLLFPKLWVAIVGAAWMLLMAFSRTGLHAHWLSDTVGGMLVGVGVVFIVAGLFAPLLDRERTRIEATARH
jgi:membrane-associated phospholipid phosphatase